MARPRGTVRFDVRKCVLSRLHDVSKVDRGLSPSVSKVDSLYRGLTLAKNPGKQCNSNRPEELEILLSLQS